MAVPMEDASEISSRERVQRLYNKNVELENKRRRSAQSRIPSDPIVWQQMRDNFEIIILEDYAFAEQHEIEFALWQLHYGRIEELRAHFNAAMSSCNSSLTGQGGKAGRMHSDRLAKIRTQFKTFLSEATGFYHELMLKIRAKHGLSLSYFSSDSGNEAFVSEEGNGSADLRKGLLSCHRCLIYLGDLARYKGIYGEGESKLRDFAAASSYYLQACSCWPSSGNPHHQLAILASYSGDEFVAIYRYFRSLAVEIPFSMARDNLVIAFEKNRQNFSQFMENSKASSAKSVALQNGKGRARNEIRFSAQKVESDSVRERRPGTTDALKAFSVKFVRLHGILFTRTSIETFADVLMMAKNDFLDLLLSCSEEDHSFGSDAADSGLYILRLVVILIFTVHNANRESGDQSYAEILRRTVLFQNACTAAFEFMGHIVERCTRLHDPLSDILLPGVLTIVEWLAHHPEVVTGSEGENLVDVRMFFWNSCVSFFNRLVSTRFVHGDDEEINSCNMSKYEEGKTMRWPALWEDYQLRGFLPLQPAQQVLDFSRKHSFRNDYGNKEKKSRVQRIFAAAKSLSGVVRVGRQILYFDPVSKKFAIGVEPKVSRDIGLISAEAHELYGASKDSPVEVKVNSTVPEPALVLVLDGEDEEEEIVFKPSISDKQVDGIISILTSGDTLKTVETGMGPVPASHDAVLTQSALGTSEASLSPLSGGVAHTATPSPTSASNAMVEQEDFIVNEFRNFSLMEDGCSMNMKLLQQCGVWQHPSLPNPFMVPKAVLPSQPQANLPPVSLYNDVSVKPVPVSPVGPKKNPVSIPSRHVGPANHSAEVTVKDGNPLMDDYSWLDGYQMLSDALSSGFNSLTNLNKEARNSACKGSNMSGMAIFPFPGKQASSFQVPAENTKIWQDYQLSQPQNLYQENEQKHQFLSAGNQQPMPLQKQSQGQSLWEGYFLV